MKDFNQFINENKESSLITKGKLFFISDTHFDDDRLNLYGRDLVFKNSKEVDEHIIQRCNEIIPKDATLYHLGDVSMTLEGLENINKIECKKKILIKGNYDISKDNGGTSKFEITDKILLKYFDEVYDDLEIKIGDEMIYLNHFPVNIREDVFNICGHIHGLWKCCRNGVNVGVDCWHFTPVSEELIKFQINGVRNHYDQNVYVDELVANINHRRGEVKVLRAPDYDKVATFEENPDLYIFLAGPAQGCKNWQEEFIEKIKNGLKDVKLTKNVVLCTPRRLEKPKDFNYEQQVEWESCYLNKAGEQGFIVFWFAKETEKIDGRSFARTSRFEIGEWFAKSLHSQTTIVLGRENGFEGFDYIENRFKSRDDKFKIATTESEMIKNILSEIKEKIKL